MLIQRTAEKELQSLARDYKAMKPYIADDIKACTMSKFNNWWENKQNKKSPTFSNTFENNYIC
ncbi:MAG: hypothetical protein GXY66_05835 [Bacteroidales bacterium]|nr:hypothetical protein [Bacteroidales bacterium]